MKKMRKWIMVMTALLLIAGCNQSKENEKTTKEEVTEVSSAGQKKEETKQVNTTEKKEESKKSSTTEKEKKEIEYVKRPLEIIKQEKNLYQNTEGITRYLGYTTDGDDQYILAIEMLGEMQKIKDNNMKVDVILEDSEHGSIRKSNIIEVRKSNKGKIFIYKSNLKANGRKIVRLDVDVTGDGQYEPVPVKLPSPNGKTTIKGVEIANPLTHRLNLKKEGSRSIVSLKSVAIIPPDYKRILITGTMEFKEDTEAIRNIPYTYPYASTNGEADIVFENGSTEMFSGTKVPFQATINIEEPIGKNEGVIYFSIDDVMFGIDLATGKDVDSVPLAQFSAKEIGDASQRINLLGFEDVEGIFHYDALQADRYGFNKGPGTENRGSTTFMVSDGYKTLNFMVGAGMNHSLNDKGYIIQVYGDDYNYGESGKPLLEKKITKESAMEKVQVNIEENHTITILFKTGINSGDSGADDLYFPVIFSNISLNK